MKNVEQPSTDHRCGTHSVLTSGILEVETTINSELTRTLETLNQRRCRNQRALKFEDQCFEDDNEEKDA